MAPITPAEHADEDRFLSAPQVRQRYGGASAMWLHRRLHDDSGFPPPDLVVNERRFWKLSALVRWERERAGVRPTSSPSPSVAPTPRRAARR
jgi:hypothetical protein